MTTESQSHYPIIAMIRHGAYQQRKEVPSALQPFALTEEGKQEVVLAANSFAKQLIENDWQLNPIIHSSNQLRAWQTADIYRQELAGFFLEDPRHVTHNDLSERSVGCMANLTITEIESVLDADPRFDSPKEGWKSDSYYCLPLQGAESLMMAGERVSNYLTQHTTDNNMTKKQSISLFFGHGASFRHAAFHLNIITLSDIKKFSMHHAQPVMIQKQHDGTWRHVAGEWKIRKNALSFND
ncbi:histidine phosphatase family protein [Marinomonas sp. 2405UD68-3]|uniref:histidine phosphatase family protein n=1 Tax=Marinomonas sp. 2405UD68-3 TaxID=3391835 RepID=UPI0039C9C847